MALTLDLVFPSTDNIFIVRQVFNFIFVLKSVRGAQINSRQSNLRLKMLSSRHNIARNSTAIAKIYDAEDDILRCKIRVHGLIRASLVHGKLLSHVLWR